MEGFKNSTRMKIISDVAPQAYAKGGSVKPMVKAAAKAPAKKADAKYPVKRKDGDLANMTAAERRASMEQTSRAMTPAQTRALQALKTAKAAAPKQGPLIKPAREMTPAERRMNQMDRPTNSRGAEGYKNGGKISKSAADEYRIAGDIASRDYDDLKKVGDIPAGVDIDAEGPYRYKTVSKLKQMAADDTHKRGGNWGDERLGSVRMKYQSGKDAKKWAFAGTQKERSALLDEDDKALSPEEGAARSKRLIDMYKTRGYNKGGKVGGSKVPC